MRSLMRFAMLLAVTSVAMAQIEDANVHSICQMARRICASGGSTCADAAKTASQYHCTGISVSTSYAGPRLAGACPQPGDPPQIPDGRHATLAQMIAAQHAVKRFNDELVAYGTCVHKSSGRKDVIATYNAYVDRLKVVADCFNEQVYIFKSTHGGAGSSTSADCHFKSDDEIARGVQTQVSSDQSTEVADSTSAESTSSEAPPSESPADWLQDHQAKIDELTQEIANHEQQAQQDDAEAEQAAAQAQADSNASASGPGAAWLALGHLVQGSANAGLAVKMRQDAADERQAAQEEREQLADLGAEQPPVAENNSENIALTRMQTQMTRSSNTIQGALNQQEDNLQAVQQAAREESERSRDEENSVGGRTAAQRAASQSSESQPAGVVPQVPPTGTVTVTFRGLRSPHPGEAIVTDSVNDQHCPPDCSFTFPPGAYGVHFYAQADANSIFRSFEGNCVWGGDTAPRTPGNSGGCSLGNPSLATTITVYVDPADTTTAGGSAGGGASSSNGSNAPGGGGGTNGGSNGYALRCQRSGCVPALSASCVSQFNDPRYYNWISLRNGCGQPIDLQFSRIGIGGAGEVTLAPGASANTGFADSEAPNGMTIAVCPAGYVAWSTQTDGIWMGSGGFACLRNP